MTVWPATVNVPIRVAPVFAAAVNATDPLPETFDPEVMVNHVALLAAVQEHPVCVVTEIGGPAPPPAATDGFSGVTTYEQVTVPASWLIGTVKLPIVSTAVRRAPLLGATLKVRVPLPVPLVRPVRVIHGTLLEADHPHVDATETAIELLAAPDAGKVTSLGVAVTVQSFGVGVVGVGGGVGVGVGVGVGEGSGGGGAPSCVIFTV